MFGIEKQLYNQLCNLRDNYSLDGIKAEFEAEGSSLEDLIRLRRITIKADVKLYLKIGGVEALRDIKDAMRIGVDGVIAPMVESVFAAKKFHDTLLKTYDKFFVDSTLNIETRDSIDQLENILEFASERFNNITIGRSDLSSSYFDREIKPDSDFIFQVIENIAPKIVEKGLKMNLGGSLSSNTIQLINDKFPTLKSFLNNLETRKVIMPSSVYFEKEDAIKEALKFEELWILSKKEFLNLEMGNDIARLTQLMNRI